MVNRLQIDQLNTKMNEFSSLRKHSNPATGWIRSIRTSIGMSLAQLADRMNIARQNVQKIEKREAAGNVTIKTLQQVAKAMDMQLIYGFIPVDGSLDALIERKARELATKIVMRTSNSMKLEGQANTEERLQKAIEERTEELKKEVPKILWD